MSTSPHSVHFSLAAFLAGRGGSVPRERYQQPTLQRSQSGAWFIRPWVDVIENGVISRRQRTINLASAETGKREAQALSREAMQTINRAAYMIQSQVDFSHLLKLYKERHIPNLSASTRAKYEQHIEKHIERAWKNRKLYEITGTLFETWVRSLTRTGKKGDPSTPLSWSTKTDLRNLMSGIFERAIAWKLYQDENPIAHVHVGRKRLMREKRKLTDDQTRKLLAALPGDVRIMAAVALFCGLRVSEVLGLQEKHIDFSLGVLKIEQRYYRGDVDVVKSQKAERSVPMGYLCDPVALLCTGDPERFVFEVRTGQDRVSRDDGSIRRYFLKPAAVSIGCYYIGFGWHALRREAVTAFNAELGVTQAMRLAGHSTADMSADYTLADRARQDAAVRGRQERLMGEVKGGTQ